MSEAIHSLNIIVWFDGTFMPRRGHKNCDGRWDYDGQVMVFSCSCASKSNVGEKPNKGRSLLRGDE